MASNKGIIKRRVSLEEPPNMSSSEPLRILVFGSSLHQILLTHSVLGPGIFTRADVTISAAKKSSGVVQKRSVTLVNTSNFKDNDLPDKIQKEFRKAVCFSCPGPHAVFFVLDPFNMTSETIHILNHVVHFLGESILKHSVVVLYHERRFQSLSTEDEVKRNKNFRELVEKCGQNYLFFNEEKNKIGCSETQALLAKIDEMVLEHGIYSNPEFKDAEKRIQIEKHFIRKSKEKEINNMMKALKKEHSGEMLDREIKKYEEKLQLECREMAELIVADKLGFTVRLVDYAAAVGKGAFVGALLGMASGYEGMAVSAAIGAGLGGILGGAANAAWSYIANYLADVHRETP